MFKRIFLTACLVASGSAGLALPAAAEVSGQPPVSQTEVREAAARLLSLAQGGWSALSRTAVAITGGVQVKDNILIFNGNTRYAIEPTSRVGQSDGIGGVLEVEGAPFFSLKLIGQSRVPASRIRGPVYLRDGNTLCGEKDNYLYAQFETPELGGVANAVLSVRIFEPPKKGPNGRPHYCAAYNYLKEVDDARAPRVGNAAHDAPRFVAATRTASALGDRSAAPL